MAKISGPYPVVHPYPVHHCFSAPCYRTRRVRIGRDNMEIEIGIVRIPRENRRKRARIVPVPGVE